MWSHSNTYSLSGHALSALSTCCGERERATHESQQHFELNANRSRAHYVKNVTNIIRSSWPIHELTSSSTSTSSPRCLRRRCSECAYVVKLLLLQLRVIFLLSCAEIARALSLSSLSLNLCLSSMALSPFQKTCLSCTNTLSHTFRSLSHSLSFCLSCAVRIEAAAAAATSAYWFVLCLNFFQFFCCVQSRRRSAVIVVPS